MAENGNVEQRLAELEKDVASIKERLNGDDKSWPDRLVGRFENFPEWADIVQLGREACEQGDAGE